MIRFLLVRLPLDIISNRLFESVNICTGIGCFKINSSCLRIARASSNKPENTMTSADSTDREIRLDLYDLYETGTALLEMSVSNTMHPSLYDELALLAKAALLHATTRRELKSNLGIRIEALLSCVYVMTLLRRLQSLDTSDSHIARVLCAICKI